VLELRELKNNMNEKQVKYNFKKSLIIIVVIFIIFTSFITGFFLGTWKSIGQKTDLSTYLSIDTLIRQSPNYLNLKNQDINLFWQVWETVLSDYVNQPVDQTKMFYGAISGIVSSLGDPYSIFLDPQMSQEFQKELSGKFEGIGAEIGFKNNYLSIIAPLPGSPAEKAGLKAGDKILKIDNNDTQDMNLDYAVSLIRGKKGTTVTLNILSSDQEQPKDLTIKRDVINTTSVTWELKNDTFAYIKVAQFDDNATSAFNKIVNEIILKNPKGIILDLRNNPGGYLDSALDMADKFLDEKVVMYEESAKGDKKEFKSKSNPSFKDVKTVVLVNEGSASGSEIVAGALQDNQRATIVGEKTFGKGTVQDLKDFNDGSTIKLTVAKWLTPDGRSITDNGIKPDVEVKITQEDLDKDYDPQLDKAIEILSQ